MKLILENWQKFLKENKSDIYYWQTRGAWKGEAAIGQHVPKARPRKWPLIEKIFEQVRQKQFPDRPSRLNCVFLCENLNGFAGGSFCSYPDPLDEKSETYIVKLINNPKVLKTNSEIWTTAVMRSEDYTDSGIVRNRAEIKRWAEGYWKGDNNPTMGEILVSPPEAAIIVEKYRR